MDDLVEQSAETLNSDDQGSASGASESEYLQHEDHSEAGEGQGSEQVEDPDEEIEIGDKKVALPKSLAEKLKSERMMHADYTQKTQQAAEERRQIAAEREQVQRTAQEHQQFIAEIAKVHAISDQLAEYDALDWNAIIESDPVRAMQLQQNQRTLQAKQQSAIQEVTNKQHQFALNEQQSTAKQIQDAKAFFEREIKGWDDKLDTEVHQYTLAQGITNDQAVRMSLQAPAIVKLAHKAMLYDRLVAKQAVTKQPPAAEVKPALRVGVSAPVKKDPSNMSDKEFAAWRRSQIKNRS
jgi:hypothetical protein